MSESSFDKRRKALEESYFEKKNREALEILAKQIEKKDKLCPVTNEALQEKVLHGVIVYFCDKTKGMWIEQDQLERLFNESDSEDGIHWGNTFFEEISKQAKEDLAHGKLKVAQEEQGERLSPATRQPMVKFEIDGVVLDRCEESGGIWFDANELDLLLEKARKDPEHEELTMPSWVHSLFKSIGYK